VFEVDFRKVRVIDVHFADSLKQFGSVKGKFGLDRGEVTCWAEGTSANSMKNLVTSPL
jgi:hypothetical protein